MKYFSENNYMDKLCYHLMRLNTFFLLSNSPKKLSLTEYFEDEHLKVNIEIFHPQLVDVFGWQARRKVIGIEKR